MTPEQIADDRLFGFIVFGSVVLMALAGIAGGKLAQRWRAYRKGNGSQLTIRRRIELGCWWFKRAQRALRHGQYQSAIEWAQNGLRILDNEQYDSPWGNLSDMLMNVRDAAHRRMGAG